MACATLVTWKVTALGYSLDPTASADRWNVQLTARARGTGEGARLQLAVPADGEARGLYDQSFRATGLKLSGVRTRGDGRFAAFTADATRPAELVTATWRFSARVQDARANTSPSRPAERDRGPSATVPSDDPAVLAKARELTPTADSAQAKVRAVYDFVLDEVVASSEADTETDSAIEALTHLRGSPMARVRLFAALARALSVPTRLVRAVPLVEGADRPLLVRAEVYLGDEWVPVDPVHGRFGHDASEGLVLLRGADGTLVRGDGLSQVELAASVTREGLNEYGLYQRRLAREATFIDQISLHGLPPRLQLAMRLLLLVPLGALIVSVFRNIVGTPTFGTFMPILIALALRETSPLAGLLVLGVVVAVGIAGRRVLDGLRLLVVPRLSLLLTFVIFIVGALAVGATHLGFDDVLGAALLPMVIMTMTIERVGVLIEEEGVRSALKTTGGTVLVAATGYTVLQSDALQRMVFTFPELNLLVVAALLLVGRYTGFRLTELLRFRRLASAPDVTGAS